MLCCFLTQVAVCMSQPPSKAKPQKQKVSQGMMGNSELVRNLQHLLEKDWPASQARFSERLTQNMDFSSSLKLSELHGHLRLLDQKAQQNVPGHSAIDQKKALNSAFDRVHHSIVQNIEQSFDDSVEQPRFPLPKVDLEGESLGLKVYQSFYQAQQTEMSAKIQGLRTYVRETLSSTTLMMKKLSVLDQTLEDTIGFPLRSGFSAVSKVIAKHSQKIEAQLVQNDSQCKNKLLVQFHSELHKLLLAELELRLQPVQGLIDAFNQEV